MPMGRPPKPIEQKIMEGRRPGRDSGGRRLPEPVLLGGRVRSLADIPCPASIKSEEGRSFWESFVGRLAAAGVLDLIDVFALEMMTEQYVICLRAKRVLDLQGYMTRGSTGQMVPHPAVRIVNEAQDRYLRLADHFGGTVLARSRIGLTEVSRRTLAAELDRTLGSAPRP